MLVHQLNQAESLRTCWYHSFEYCQSSGWKPSLKMKNTGFTVRFEVIKLLTF